VTATDAGLATGSQTFTWTVTNVNRAPVVSAIANQTHAEDAAITLPVLATDPDGDALTYSATPLPEGLTLNPTTGVVSGTLSYASAAGSPYTVTVTATDASGNSSTCSFTVTITPLPPPGADLSLTATAAPNPVTLGRPLTYTLTIDNHGPSPATDVWAVHTVLGFVRFVSATSTQGRCFGIGGLVACNTGTLPNGATATVTIVVVPLVRGNLTGTAWACSPVTDPNQANNAATVTTRVR